eukprot:TRINITY_DN2205_c0_g1_i2.p1 TRINITY_DN2205_c0_g1~~TRINITY_DN2205_c0_g1_i2.p1  ORF type:complete len:241 (-),score=52.26 TRINITY_DN2205_c0_g1_i2:31-753(-)
MNKNFKKIAALGTHLTNYWAITHPSQPNYVAQVAGSTLTCHNDDYVTFGPEVTSLADLMEARGVEWKAYEEDYPGNCYDGTNQGKYYRKHNPFMGFEAIRRIPSRCARIVNADQLAKDIAANELPQYMYYTPNIDNDGHNTGLDHAGEFLMKFLPPLLNNPIFMNDTMVVVTWDEDDYTDPFGNHVSTILVGPNIRVNYEQDVRYTHYSLLATVEDNWGLGTMNRNDTLAAPFSGVYVHE